jgi:hypothetical protein
MFTIYYLHFLQWLPIFTREVQHKLTFIFKNNHNKKILPTWQQLL